MTPLNIKDLLLASRLDRDQVDAMLRPYGFKDPFKADSNLQDMAAEPSERQLLAEILEDLLASVANSADPDQSLTYLERFATAALNKTRLFTYLKESSRAIEILAKTLGGSAYMAEILIRDPQLFYWVADPEILQTARRKREIQFELLKTIKALPDERTRLDYLRVFKRKEMLHIGVRDLLRVCSVVETLTALSVLAESLISAAYWISATELRREYNIPKNAFTGFTILGMGKLGAGELNFSSDVDLVYLYASNDETAGTLTAPEFFRRLSQKITRGLDAFTDEGYVYRVDLRLRPEGHGDIASPLDGFERYYQSRIGTWERLALLKACPIAGNRALGRAFLNMVRKFIYDLPFDSQAEEDIRSIKRKIEERMKQREQHTRNVKLGAGGIREIELIAQSLQVRHGGTVPEIRVRKTLSALATLCDQSLISVEECQTLTDAYIFLRDVENKLQMVNDAQTHSLPREHEELQTSARLLGYENVEDFLEMYRRHTTEVSRIFARYI